MMVSPLHIQACKHAQNKANVEALGSQLADSSISEGEQAGKVLTAIQDEVSPANASSIDETSSLRITLTSSETSDAGIPTTTVDSAALLIVPQTQTTPKERSLATALASALRQLDNKRAQLADGWTYVRDLKRCLDSTKAALSTANSELDIAEANEIEAEERLAATKHRADRFKARVTDMQRQQKITDAELDTAHKYTSTLKGELRDAKSALKVAAVEMEAEKALRESSDALLVASCARAMSLEAQLSAALARSEGLEAELRGKV